MVLRSVFSRARFLGFLVNSDQAAWSTVCELLVASLPPKDALPTLSSVYLVCELYVSNCMTMSHVLSKQHGTRWTSTHLTNREGLMS